MRTLFTKKKVSAKECKDIVFSMVRVIAQNEGDVLVGLLELIAPYYGEGSTLSIVEAKSRDIIATTEEKECREQLKRTAGSVKSAVKDRRYLIDEKNTLLFRNGYSSIRIIPFRKVGVHSAFLMVEQKRALEPSIERCMEVLEIAVRVELYEYLAKKNAVLDLKTGLLSRDVLIRQLKKPLQKETFLGMYYLLNGDELGINGGIAEFDCAMYGIARVVERYFPKRCYAVSDRKIAVMGEGTLFEVSARLQDCLDGINAEVPQAKVGCVLSPVMEEVYHSMYLCEKACEDVSVDAVLIIRSPQEFFSADAGFMDLLYKGEPGKEEYRETFERPWENDSPDDGYDEDDSAVSEEEDDEWESLSEEDAEDSIFDEDEEDTEEEDSGDEDSEDVFSFGNGFGFGQEEPYDGQ